MEDSASKRYKTLVVNLSNSQKVEEAIRLSYPDLIFHLAPESPVERLINNSFEFISINTL